MFRCVQCTESTEFETESARSNHVREVHQEIVVIGERSLKRNADGKFRCPQCNASLDSTYKLRYHLSKCSIDEDDLSINDTDQEVVDEGSSQTVNEEAFVDHPNSQGVTVTDAAPNPVHYLISTCFDSPILQEANLIVNAKFNCLICTVCCIVINSKYNRHLRSHKQPLNQKRKALINDAIQSLSQSRSQDIEKYIKGQPPLQAIEGLPVFDGFECSVCKGLTSSSNVNQSHRTSCKGSVGKVVKIQYPFGRNKVIVKVELETQQMSYSEQEVRDLLKIPVDEIVEDDTVDNEHKSLFCVLTGWNDYVSALPEEFLTEIESFQLDQALTANLKRSLTAFFWSCKKLANTSRTALPILQILNNENGRSQKPFTFVQTPRTVDRYVIVIMDLFRTLFFLLESTTLASVEAATPRLNDSTVSLLNEMKNCTKEDRIRFLFIEIFRELLFRNYNLNTIPTTMIIQFHVIMLAHCKHTAYDANSITPKLAGLKFFCRLIVLSQVTTMNENTEIMRTLEFVQFDPSRLNEFTNLCNLMNLLRRIANDQFMSCKIQWDLDSNYETLYIEGVKVTMQNLKSNAHSLMLKLESTMQELLLLDPELIALKVEVDAIVDPLGCNLVNYSFLNDPRNADIVKSYKPKLFNLVYGKYKEDFFVRNGSTLNPNMDTCLQWLNHLESFHRQLLVLVHLTGGGPPRATEACITRLCNSKLCYRNLFIHGRYVMTLYTYNKSQSMTQEERPISRFLPLKLGDTIMKYLLIVRPFMISLLPLVYRSCNVKKIQKYLFLVNFEVPDDEDYRNVFHAGMLANKLVPVSILPYRHIAKAMFEERIKRSCPKNQLPFSLQFGHSEETSESTYGTSLMDPKGIAREDIHLFLLCSASYHDLLGLGSEERTIENTSDLNRSKNNAIINQSYTSASVPEVSGISASDVNEIKLMLSTALNRSKEEDLPPSVEDWGEQSVKILRELLNNPNAIFRSSFQAMACNAVMNPAEDVLVILGTASGKSMLFMISSTFNRTKVTVLVVPYRSLAFDITQECRKYRVSHAVWPEQASRISNGLVIVPIEHIATKEFQGFLLRMKKEKALNCVFLDEVHTVLQESSFRQCMKSVLEFRTVAVPVVLMTATLPFKNTGTLIKDFQLINPRVIRSPTTIRSNISFVLLETDNVEREVLDKVRNVKNGKIVIYCMTVEQCISLNRLMQNSNIESYLYYAELSKEVANTNYQRWKLPLSVVKCMIATTSFGCGINLPNIRLVINAYGVYSLENYVQMSGRVCRDGELGLSILIFNRSNMNANTPLELKRYLEQRMCNRMFLGKYFDIVPCNCRATGAALCSFCMKNNQEPRNTSPSLPLSPYVVASASLVTAQVNENEASLRQFLNYCKEYGKYCMVCIVKRKLKRHELMPHIMHHLSSCPSLSKKECFSCLGSSRECSDKKKCPFQFRSTGLCFFCYLPLTAYGIEIHNPDMFCKSFESCPTMAKHVSKKLFSTLYRFDKDTLGALNKDLPFMPESDYFKWLTTQNPVLPNLVQLCNSFFSRLS